MKSFATLTQITVFVRIAESGSLTAAARDLNLSPSAVSKSLAQLEERLGVLLVKRTTRALTLTESGRIMFERANALLADVEETLDATRQSQRLEGTLRLTSSVAFGSRQLTPILSEYLQGNPGVNASIALDDQCVNLAEANYDLAIRITGDTDSAYAARKLTSIRWVYCASPAYLSNRAAILCPSDLVKHECLVYPSMTLDGSWTFRCEESTEHINVRAKLTSNSSVALRQAALGGYGVACLPTYLVVDDILTGKLSIVLPEYRAAITHTLYAMYYRSKYAHALVRSFIDFIVGQLGSVPPWDAALMTAINGPGLGAPNST